ncbi:hypothetical protein MRX96_043239 [Rhipicephalus microplus]
MGGSSRRGHSSSGPPRLARLMIVSRNRNGRHNYTSSGALSCDEEEERRRLAPWRDGHLPAVEQRSVGRLSSDSVARDAKEKKKTSAGHAMTRKDDAMSAGPQK